MKRIFSWAAGCFLAVSLPSVSFSQTPVAEAQPVAAPTVESPTVEAPVAAAAQPVAAPVAAEAAEKLPNGVEIAKCLAPIEGMSCVPGGKFIRGADDDEHNLHCKQSSYNNRKVKNTYPSSEVWLQTYYMDKTEVTTEAYKACVAAKKCVKSGPKYVDFDRPKQPITGISWYEANAYCKAQGKHLPTEAEWEKAARGPSGDLYPWGNEPVTCENAVIMDEKKGRSCGVKKRGKGPEKGRVLEVCSRGAYRYELCDMIGNAEEWVADWYSPTYEACGEACTGIDPKGPCGGDDGEKCGKMRAKSVRGGSWYWPVDHATGMHRRSHIASNNPGHHFGFRCAASQQEMEKLIEVKK